MAYSAFNDWTLPGFNLNSTDNSDFGAIDYGKLAEYLEKNPAGSYGALPPDAFSFDANTILVPPPILNAEEAVSSPESSSAASSSNDRQDSAPLELLPRQQRTTAVTQPSNNKRKTSGDAAPTATASLKDSRKGSAKSKETVQHSHQGDEAPIAKNGKKANTTDKRKEQNRNAQRAFRERREKHTKELEDQVAVLEAAASERETENQNLKDMVTRLRSENERLAGTSFTFSMPPALDSTSSLAPAPSVSPPVVNGTASLLPGLAAAQPAFAAFDGKPNGNAFLPFAAPNGTINNPDSYPDSPNDLFGPPVDPSASFSDFSDSLFTPSGEHLNPFAGFEEILANASTTMAPPAFIESALSPGSAEALFSAYRDPSASSNQQPSSLQFGGFEPFTTSAASSTPSLVESRTPPVAVPERNPGAECHVFRESLGSLRGAEEFDLDSLCKDMMQKATCKQAAAVALEKAVSDDIDIHSFFSEVLADEGVKSTYSLKP